MHLILCACFCSWKITTVDCLAVARQRACSGAWFLCGSFRDANVPVVREGASEIKTLPPPPCEEYPVLLSSALNHSSLLQPPSFFFSPACPPKRPILMSRLYKRWGGSGLRAHSCISQESVSTRHHAEDTICRCWHDLVSVCFFWQSCIEEFYYSPSPSGVPCDNSRHRPLSS